MGSCASSRLIDEFLDSGAVLEVACHLLNVIRVPKLGGDLVCTLTGGPYQKISIHVSCYLADSELKTFSSVLGASAAKQLRNLMSSGEAALAADIS